MGGLLNTLDIASSSLSVARQGVETSGVNLANVNNPSYARARLIIEPRRDPTGAGSGVQVIGIASLRDAILDDQVLRETSTTTYLQNYQRALQLGQVLLGQQIDRQSATPEAEAAARDLGGQLAVANGLSEFANAIQAASLSPASSADRQVLLMKAGQLADKFNSTDQRLERLQDDLDLDLGGRLKDTNQILSQLAKLANDASSAVLIGGNGGVPKDILQGKLEELSKFVSFQTTFDDLSRMSLTVNGVEVITANVQSGRLELQPVANGRPRVAAVSDDGTQKASVTGGGALMGLIEARDSSLQQLRDSINTVATDLITKFNAIHATGKNLDGGSGLDFFQGTGSSDIRVNAALLEDWRKVQLSGNGAPGDNTTALALAKAMGAPQDSLGKLSFLEHYNQTVVAFGQDLANINNRLADQEVISHNLTQTRNSIMGVSIDEEMSTLIQYQRAYQASARLLTTVNELFASLLTM
ncbi:MAG: flagellar hook-associated protein FlgK [Verrucomicrobiota bacterium]